MSPVRVPGEHDEFESFFRAHTPRVRAYVRTFVPANEVDSVVAATFATAWQKFADIRGQEALPWLLGVARNHGRSMVRSEVRRAAVRAQYDLLRHRTSSALHDGVLDPAQVDAVLDAMAALSADDQELLQLALWHELQPSEIAEVLHLKPDTARQRLLRARQRLTVRLASLAVEGGDRS